ncbi:serologically defined colon cancer antigen 8-like [Haliotis rufescens]|uniref:serologically defined colon cancer antigen 8-like n=1 Tax=Haliotis rufescens TaxID=6454 RepID=UPI001EB091A0|nr:serologically defined colon cancer antigen 8-like [Haliotis rufescens]
MYYFKDYNGGNPTDDLQRSVRDRANESLNELRGAFDTPSGLPTPSRAKDDLSRAVHPRILTYEDGGQRPQKYRDAALHLQQMLSPQPERVSDGPDPSPVPARGPLPTPDEAAIMLQHQASLTHHLESENRYIREEMTILRLKLGEVLDENKRLHDELKTTVVHEILREGGADLAQYMGSLDSALKDTVSPGMARHDYRRWQVELERLSSLHANKSERLESQLAHARSELEKYEQMVEDLRSQLRMHDTIPTHENGLSTNIFLSDTHRAFHQQTIDRLTKERDELMDHVASLKGRLVDMTRREEDSYVQMKKGIELVEQAQLEQTQAMVEREQLAEELANMRHRFEEHVMDSQRKMEMERDSVRKESRFLVDDLNNKLKEATEKLTVIETRLEKVTRDKMSVMNELDETKAELRVYNKEVTVATENYRSETTNASLQRSSAVQESHKMRMELDSFRRDRDQERSRSQTEVDDLRRRLNTAERELVNSKEECIHLTTNAQALERELHLAKLARESIERTRNEDLKSITKQAQQREIDLNNFISNLEDKHSMTTHEMDTMLHKQNRLIMKLRDECKRQAGQMEKLTKKYRSEFSHLKIENEELKQRLERSLSRLEVLEDQSDQHVRVHDKMKERLKMMDDHAQHQSSQMLEILTKLSSVVRDRQLLAREVDFLRTQLSRIDQSTVHKLSSSSKALVDEILNAVTKEEKTGKGHLNLDPEIYKVELTNNINIDDLV